VLFAILVMSLTLRMLAAQHQAGDAGLKEAALRTAVVEQVELIRAKLIMCASNYPAGNNGLGYRLPYPAAPASGLVSDLQCPGAPAGWQTFWNGTDGVFAPKPLQGMSAWSYVHDATGIRVAISVQHSTSSLQAGLRSAALALGSQASVAGSTLTVTLCD
jgi:hypothetical protein